MPKPEFRILDPRHYQIAILLGLLTFGLLALDFDLRWPIALAILATAQLAQWMLTRLFALPSFEPRSALISSLSLCLLLRTNHLGVAALAALLTVGSKFLIRARDKHVFNPANFGIAVTILLTQRAWVSPGQWGSTALLAFATACLGGLVVSRAARSDITVAFGGFYLTLLFGRALWLGDPLAIPLHQLQSGAFLIFTFFMISDPKTTPDSRAGRILFALLVAAVAGWIRFGLYRPNDLIWALALSSPAVPVIDRLLPGRPYQWDLSHLYSAKGEPMKRVAIVALLLLTLCPRPATPFCGFYVAKADTKLFNEASQVVLVRDEDRTVLTMVNDFKGDVREFAIVIPVPTFIEKGQIHVGDRAIVDHLDAYTAPRLVEYFDENPCQMVRYKVMESAVPASAAPDARRAQSLGVTIEAQYTVGEYDILILSAEESQGLETWLRENDYRIPEGATDVLGSYLKQDMRFFVARVNLTEYDKLGFSYLRPLQVAYETPKFILPIRLGTVNAKGPQELFVFALTRQGRVETTNYRTVKLPSGMDIPIYVKDEFGQFYRDMFSRQVEKEEMRAVFLEYAWDMAWCDPCAADPLSIEELRGLGVFWVGDEAPTKPGMRPGGGAQNVFVTRLHLRYDRDHFPEDLSFQVTSDRQNFQGRYVLRHPWTGDDDCPEADQYRQRLYERREERARTLASLTGWDINEIRTKMDLGDGPPSTEKSWWDRLWGE